MQDRSRLSDSDEGFTLVEMIVSITILGGVFVALALVLMNMLAVTLQSRQNQQAGDLISAKVEDIRRLSYAGVSLNEDAAAFTDGGINTSVTPYQFDPDGSGALGAEEVVYAAAGGFAHVETVQRNGTEFTLRTYVTTVDDATVTDAAYKRVIVRAFWERGRRTYEREADTLLTDTRRGLPLPKFTFRANDTQTKDTVDAPSGAPYNAEFVFKGTITNRGARDWWNITATVPRASWTPVFYADTNGSGIFDVGDIQMNSSDTDFVPDTGAIETDDAFLFFTVLDLPATEATGANLVVKVTARSGAQPTAGTAALTLDYTVNVL